MKLLITIILLLSGSIAFAQKDTGVHEILLQPIKDSDILWKKRVWRVASVYEKQNIALRDIPSAPQENILANILLHGVSTGLYKAYNTDSLKYQLTEEEVKALISCDPAKLSAAAKSYLNSQQALLFDDTTSVASCVYPQQVDQYGILEDWLYDKAHSEMIVRIKAIAPMVKGKPLFWFFYPDIRKSLAQHEVYQPNREKKMTWDEYFESRQFSSKIMKVGSAVSTFQH